MSRYRIVDLKKRNTDHLARISALENQLEATRLIIKELSPYKPAFEAMVYKKFGSKTLFRSNNRFVQEWSPILGYLFAILPDVHRTPLQWFLSTCTLGDISIPGVHHGKHVWLYE